jgi:hypothetical protein
MCDSYNLYDSYFCAFLCGCVYVIQMDVASDTDTIEGTNSQQQAGVPLDALRVRLGISREAARAAYIRLNI